jgi:hypothetical protein
VRQVDEVETFIYEFVRIIMFLKTPVIECLRSCVAAATLLNFSATMFSCPEPS